MNIEIKEHVKKAKPLLRWLRRWWHHNYVEPVGHQEVIDHVRSEGRLSSRYSFMALMSCGIAMLGLLLSSPAVVIGAMLISPLMGPIVSLGFSLCVLDLRQLRKCLEGIFVGIGLALAVSYIIVSLSPLTDPTPEILARTQPNLFDLLVAIFSGLAGGYAVIKRKGEAIVGVAIATALMPPLAVTGYGLAVGSAAIAKGSFFLFMTNLLAISLSITALAKWYGFGSNHGRKHALWQTALILGAFAALSAPLGVSLKNIAYEAYATKVVRNAINERFETGKSRVSSFTISFPKKEPIRVDTVMLTKEYIRNAESEIAALLDSKLKRGVKLTLDQIVVKRQEAIEEQTQTIADSTLASPIQAQITMMTQREEMLKAINNAVFFSTRLIQADIENSIITIYARHNKDINLRVLQRFEKDMAQKFPHWETIVIPAFQPLPYLYFDVGSGVLSDDRAKDFRSVLWALQRWEVQDVEVIGFASTLGAYERFNNSSLAYRRARHIVGQLFEHGIQAKAKAEYLNRLQRREERDYGANSFHRVEVRIGRSPEIINRYRDDIAEPEEEVKDNPVEEPEEDQPEITPAESSDTASQLPIASGETVEPNSNTDVPAIKNEKNGE